MLYPLPYLILISVYAFLAYVVHTRKDDEAFCNKITMVGVLAFLVFFGFRGFIFHDWTIYYTDFEEASFSDFYNYEFGVDREIGWMIFVQISKTIYNNYHFMVFVHSVMCLVLLLIFFKRYVGNLMLAFLLYLVFDGLGLSINLMRNLIAILLYLNALPFLFNRKIIPYMLLCLLAFSFHYSAILYVPLYFFLHLKMNKWVFLTLVCVFLVFYLFNIPFFLTLVRWTGIGGDFIEKKIELYTELLSSQLKLNIGFVERVMTASLIFCYYDKLHEMRDENKMFINSFIIYLAAVFLFSDFSEVSKRFSILFSYCYWIIWADLIKCFWYRNNRRIFVGFIYIYSMLKIAAPILNEPVCEYDNLLLGGIKPYQERLYIFQKSFDSTK